MSVEDLHETVLRLLAEGDLAATRQTEATRELWRRLLERTTRIETKLDDLIRALKAAGVGCWRD